MVSHIENASQSIIKNPASRLAAPIMFFGFLLFNTLGFLAFGLHLYHFFRTILILYLANVIVFPVLLVSVVIFRRITARSRRFDKQDMLMLAGDAALFLIFVYASLIEPSRLQVERIEIVSEKVKTPFTILHVSDIQSGVVGRYEEQVFRKIRELQPDIIFHTGDLLHSYFFTDFRREQDKMAQLLRSLDPPFGIYNVIGDTDWRLNFGDFDIPAGIRTLQNQSETLSIHGTSVRLLGQIGRAHV